MMKNMKTENAPQDAPYVPVPARESRFFAHLTRNMALGGMLVLLVAAGALQRGVGGYASDSFAVSCSGKSIQRSAGAVKRRHAGSGLGR